MGHLFPSLQKCSCSGCRWFIWWHGEKAQLTTV